MENEGIGDWAHRRRVKSAHRVAIVARGGVRRDYAALAERVDRIADALERRGIGRGERVAYLGENSAEFLETLLGVAALGAIFVPLNTRWAAPELAFGLADSGARLLVHDAGFADLVAEAAGEVGTPRVAVGSTGGDAGAVDFESLVASGAGEHRDRRITLDDPAMILYTSGTTGRPKGAILTHGNLTWNALNVLVDYDVTSEDVALMVSPLFHVASLGMGALPTLLKGATLVLHERFEPAAALAAIQEHRVTTLSGVPTTFQMLAEHPDWASTDLSSVRRLTCGGSAVPARVAAAFEARGLAFSSGYGMTETSPGATSLSPVHAAARSETSGLAHFFTRVRVEAEPGAAGEILVAGPNVSPGYWGLPAESAAARDGAWFRSGDVGILDEHGFLTIVDRAKDMFVSGGENVYPAEIEGLLLELEAVAAVAVIGVADERWGEVGRAVVVLRDGATLDAADVERHLSGRVARFKIPKSVVVVAELPRTASGKVVKPELRRLYGGATS